MPYTSKEAQAAAARRHYLANKEKMKERATLHRQATRKAIQELIRKSKDTDCWDCGVKYPYYVMDFDHQGDKLFDIGNYTRGGWSLEKVRAEIAKCHVVCANCHRERTHGGK